VQLVASQEGLSSMELITVELNFVVFYRLRREK
jgi:hypothetical protein